MRKENMCLSERSLMFAIGGQLFNQAPNRQPRKAEIIMTKVRDAFREVAHNDNEYFTLVIEKDAVNKFVKDLLMNIPEFQELNLSQKEFEKNISVDDENRPKYSFSSAYDVETKESWKSDFIDLDAFIRNAIGNIYMQIDYNEDCFCCIHNESKDKCNTCTINPSYKLHYEGCRTPKGDFTFACKFDCYRSRYICCDECNDKEKCTHKCDCTNDTCGQAINRK